MKNDLPTDGSGKKKVELWNTNQILIVHLKRFGNNGYNSREKISTRVDFPIEGLDLTKYVKCPHGNEKFIYDLYAISNHGGSLSGGHYTAYGKVDNQWYDFNDSSANETQGTPERIVGQSAYVLFYIFH